MNAFLKRVMEIREAEQEAALMVAPSAKLQDPPQRHWLSRKPERKRPAAPKCACGGRIWHRAKALRCKACEVAARGGTRERQAAHLRDMLASGMGMEAACRALGHSGRWGYRLLKAVAP